MSYFMRYILVRDDITLADIDAALNSIDPGFSIVRDQSDRDRGDLYYRNDPYGEIAVNRPGDGLFDEEIQELLDGINDLDHPDTPLVQTALDTSQSMVALRVLQAGHENPDVLDHLWDWLFDHHAGMLQVDDEGYYDREGLVLPISSDEP